MCSALVLGLVSGGLGIAQSVAGYQQAQQTTAYENAAAQQNFVFQQMQASAGRHFEQMRENQQNSVIEQNRFLADKAYQDEISQLNLRLMQEQEAAAQKQQEAAKQGMQLRGEVVASGRMGASVDNLIADYYRQQAAFDYATQRNLAFTGAQVQQQKVASAATRGSRIASQQPYIQQPILDPMAPIERPQPSALPYLLSGVSAGISGFTSGYETWNKLKGSSKGAPPPAGRLTNLPPSKPK
jgi:hypothetical protein